MSDMSQRVTFGVRRSENFELRTLNPPLSRLSRKSSQSRSAILRCEGDHERMKRPAASCGVFYEILRSRYPPSPRLRRVLLAFIPAASYGVFSEGE